MSRFVLQGALALKYGIVDPFFALEMTRPTLIPMILAGGAGTRLWPLSREAAPKPFMPLPDGETLLGKTALRAASLPRRDRLSSA